MLYTGNRIGSSNLPLSVQVIRVSCAVRFYATDFGSMRQQRSRSQRGQRSTLQGRPAAPIRIPG